MEFVIILLTFGLDIILPILGIVGYFECVRLFL